MFKNLTVGKKIFLGFSSVLVLLVIVGFIAYLGLNKASDGFTQYREMARDTNLAGRLQANMLMVRMNVKDFIITGSNKDLEQYEEYKEKMLNFLSEAETEINDTERAAKIADADRLWDQYNKAFADVVKLKNERNRLVDEVLNIKGATMENHLTKTMISANEDNMKTIAFESGLAMKHLLLARLYVVKFLDSNSQKDIDRVYAELSKMEKQLTDLNFNVQDAQRRQFLTAVTTSKKEYLGAFKQLTKVIFDRNDIIQNVLDEIGPKIAKDIEDIKLSIKKVQDELGPKLVTSNSRSLTLVAIISMIALILGVSLSLIITRGISGPLSRIIEGLSGGAEEVATASGQISSTSQQLAEGASEQAASIEETSSSLEEMSSMTKQNADNAIQADSLMNEAKELVQRANEAMTELTGSIDEISEASGETSKIIKTIDEIAFQTNLLALNAAVEAARAGEAGAGFAVVADEVRNLAMRAAEAAKSTAELIEGTVKKTQDGTELVTKTNEAFSNVVESAAKVGELVGEIAAASNEQAQGIGQVNTAVAEMDKVVQNNASSAEESSSAAEEMNAQAEQMKRMVSELMAMVGSNQNGGAFNTRTAKLIPNTFIKKAVAAPGQIMSAKDRSFLHGKEINPEKVIPLDNESLSAF